MPACNVLHPRNPILDPINCAKNYPYRFLKIQYRTINQTETIRIAARM